MADNVVANAGAGGATFASDDIAGVHYPRTKVVWGADGAANDTSAAAPLPVGDAGGSLTVDGTVTANLAAGTNNIGDVDVLSVPAPLSTTGGGTEATALRVTVASDSTGVLSVDDNGSSLTVDGTVTIQDGGNVISVDDASGSLTVDQVATASSISAKLATDKMMNNLTEVTPKFAIIDAATSGDNTLVAAVASNKIRVLALFMVASAAVTARFESGAGGTALTGQMQLAANGGFVLPFNPVGWFETGTNTLLNLELSGATSVDGNLVYIEVA